MKHQFLYGRKNAGYCQLNQDYLFEDRKDLLQLETLQNYILVDGVDSRNLPLEYYAYTDEISGERVWIEGLTSFVPGGTSAESGSRDTSMIHKYIYSGEEYEQHIWAKTVGETRNFFRTVEDYQQGKGVDIESQWAKIDFSVLQEKFGFDQEQLADFIVCCLDAFPRPERRVYCYLPSADKDGSMYAKNLMETLLNILPPCVNVGAGFITYSSTFHNVSINPIPGNISVIFIPDTFENRQREVSERNNNYIFDFKNYERQNKLKHYEHIMPMISAIINDMQLGYKHNTLSTYERLVYFVKNDVAVDADFLGFFCLHIRLKSILKQKENRKEILYPTIASTIGKLLEFEETFTEAGKKEILQEVENLMQCCRYAQVDLEWIDYIYKSGELCRNKIIYCLCNACLRFAKEAPHDENGNILIITNFEYTDVDLNNRILSIIYSEERYFLVGQRLIFETLTPLKNDPGKSASKKRTLLFSSVSGLYKVYPKFVTSTYFTEEISAFLTDFLNKADDMRKEMIAISEAIEKMDKSFQIACYPVLQNLSYLVVQEFAMSGQYRTAKEWELMYCAELINLYDLDKYEERKGLEVSCVSIVEKAIRENQFDHAFASKEVKEVLRVFRQFAFEDVVSFCKCNIKRIEGFLLRCGYDEGQDDFSDWKKLFLYFCSVGDNSVIEQCLTLIMKKENLTGLNNFYQRLYQKISGRENGYEKRIVRNVIEQYRDLWHGQTLPESDQAFLADMEVSGISKYDDEEKLLNDKRDAKVSKRKDGYEGSGDYIEISGHGDDYDLRNGPTEEFLQIRKQRKNSQSEIRKDILRSEMSEQEEDMQSSDLRKKNSKISSRESVEEENKNKKNIFERTKNMFSLKKT